MENKEELVQILDNINNAFDAVLDYINVLSKHIEFRSNEVKEIYLNTIIENIVKLPDNRVSVSEEDWNDMLLYKEFVIHIYRLRDIDTKLFINDNPYHVSNNKQFNDFINNKHILFKYSY